MKEQELGDTREGEREAERERERKERNAQREESELTYIVSLCEGGKMLVA